MARIVIVPEPGAGGHPMVDPIVLAGVVESRARAFSAQEAHDNEAAAAELENYTGLD
jgi:hypothetical protein